MVPEPVALARAAEHSDPFDRRQVLYPLHRQRGQDRQRAGDPLGGRRDPEGPGQLCHHSAGPRRRQERRHRRGRLRRLHRPGQLGPRLRRQTDHPPQHQRPSEHEDSRRRRASRIPPPQGRDLRFRRLGLHRQGRTAQRLDHHGRRRLLRRDEPALRQLRRRGLHRRLGRRRRLRRRRARLCALHDSGLFGDLGRHGRLPL